MKLRELLDFIYFLFYCSASDDGTNSKYKMVSYGMELIATQLLSFIVFVIIGGLNIRFNNFMYYVLILTPCPVLSYLFINNYYFKSFRYKYIEENFSTTYKRKKIYKIITVLLFILSFVVLISGGMLMSYLLSLHG